MKFIKIDAMERVEFVHHVPFHEKHGMGKTKEQLLQEGYFVEHIPTPAETLDIAPKRKVELYFDPETETFYFK